jgi:Protein of unknown function (DUF4197)
MKKIILSTIFLMTMGMMTVNAQQIPGLGSPNIADGLKQALEIGAQNAGKKLSAVNGYFGNAAIKILMPPEASKVEKTLRSAGMGSLVDKAILSMNRAAEDAASSAAPIFINAIKQMNIGDAIQILHGSDTAATAYLRKTTTPQLTQAFRPVIDSSLQKTNATKYWSDVFAAYNKIPFTRKVNPNLSEYVTAKALDGLFYTIAQEEKNIRQNPAAQVTDLLKSVFGKQ